VAAAANAGPSATDVAQAATATRLQELPKLVLKGVVAAALYRNHCSAKAVG